MGTIILYTPDMTTAMPLDYADDGIRAGFPSPAQDYISRSIDLNRELDKSVIEEYGDLAVCCLNGEFTLKRLCFTSRGQGIRLMPSNRHYRPIDIADGDEFKVWGVVLYTIKANRRRRHGTDKWD